MKLKWTVLILFILPLSAFARGYDDKKQSLGGVKVDDPFNQVNKGNGSRADQERARKIMAELYGVGKNSKKTPNPNPSSTKGER